MKIKNREMEIKLKAAGIEWPPVKRDDPVEKKPKKVYKSSPSVKAISPQSINCRNKSLTGSDRSLKKSKRKPDKQRRVGKRLRKRNEVPNEPSISDIQEAFGSSRKSQKTDTDNISSLQPTQTISKVREGIKFKPNPAFDQKMSDYPHVTIDEDTCVTQLCQKSDIEVQLVIGLDLGTSMTKVVIGDPDRKRFYAIPFSPESSNPYLVPTGIQIDYENRVIIKTDSDGTNFFHDIKLNLMRNESDSAIIHVAAYIAQIIRFSIRWFLSHHADEYRDTRIFWTMSLGLPTDSVRQKEIEYRFRLAAITGAQTAISPETSITTDKVREFMGSVKEELNGISCNNGSVLSKDLGCDAGVIAVVPEIAAQVEGLYRSRRWDEKKPISFLMDVGAGTVDSAVFSLVNASQENKEFAFCCFSCNVSELGIANLHMDRVNWIVKNLPEDLPDGQEILKFLAGLKRFNVASHQVPAIIDEYINRIEIVRGKNDKDNNMDPDREYRKKLGDKVRKSVLQEAKCKNEMDGAWGKLRTMICGGGGRSAFYKKYVQDITKGPTAFNLDIQALEKPDNLEVPNLPSSEYDRLSVAYGLAQGTQLEFRWPDGMKATSSNKKDATENFTPKEFT